ncbi:MAG: ATP-dependent DNA helicase, partial [Opitutales bacterium]|nr:ATP-dependent DNA helicase [Opitutales bacterium]
MFSPERRDPFVLADLSDSIFRDGGSLFANMGFEHRPEQELMARMCSEAFETDSPLVFEAGTGVGKSLAYLIPGIIAAKRFRRQLVVATNTIALQEQLLRKDLPLVRLLFSRDSNLAEFADFKTAFLVGRANYLCTSRLKRAIAEKTELFRTDESAELERIAEWALCTKTGMVEELNPRPNWDVWNWVNADSSSCSPKKCPDGTCFYQKARKAVAGADVVILNHSLLFALIAAGAAEEIGTRGVLFADDMCVIDEAHLMPKVAAESFGLSISSSGMAKELRRIYDPLKKRGLITRAPSASVFEKESVVAALAAVENFFAKIRKENLVKKDTVRLASPEWTANTLEEPLSILAKNLSAIAARTQDESLSSEIKDYQRKVCAMKDAVAEAVYLGAEKHVYWLEKGGKDG